MEAAPLPEVGDVDVCEDEGLRAESVVTAEEPVVGVDAEETVLLTEPLASVSAEVRDRKNLQRARARSSSDGRRGGNGIRDLKLGRLSEDSVEILSVLDEVDLETLAGLPTAAGRVDVRLAKAPIDEGGENLRGRGRHGLEILALEGGNGTSGGSSRTWLTRTMVKLAASVETLSQATTLELAVVQPVELVGSVTW